VALTPEAEARLDRYEALLLRRGAPMGVIAPSDVARVRERHVLDCLRAVPLVPETGTAYDLGSGGGLPGIVVAIGRPELRITLVEVRRHRAAFLEDVVAELGLAHVSVHARRAETLKTPVDLCLARAFKPAPSAWEFAARLLGPHGRLIYWAGASFDPAQDTPEGVRLDLLRTPALARSGALAIMTRQ
jgi:16S rRNA (guanine527-N7)-methyltransferase